MKKSVQLVWCCLLWSWMSAMAAPDADGVIVQLKAGAAPESFQQDLYFWSTRHLPAPSLRRVVSERLHIYLFDFDTPDFYQAQHLTSIQSHPAVLAAEWNAAVEFRADPDDPEYERQWDFDIIDLPRVWDYTTGGVTARGDTIVVAVLDSGFDINHPDIRPNVWRNRAEIPGDRIDNDRNGYVDDVYGWNYLNNSPVHVPDAHGQKVIGIIGARGNNNLGISGVNWQVKLMLFETQYEDQIIAAYEYIIDQRQRYARTNGKEGAFVVTTNASWGRPDQCAVFPVWAAMYDELGKAGILTAAATANEKKDIDSQGDMISSCLSDYIITVTNTTQQDILYSGAGFGVKSIDLAAPGHESYSTTVNNQYAAFHGTSASTPHVAGVIALLYSLPCDQIAAEALSNPSQSAMRMKRALMDGVDPLPSLENKTVTGGRLNAFKAMSQLSGFCGNTAEELDILNLYPNPTRDEVTIEFETPDYDPYELKVYNALGQLVHSRKFQPEGFTIRTTTIDAATWPVGVYLVTLGRGDTFLVKKFIRH